MYWYSAHRLENCFQVRGIKQYKSLQFLLSHDTLEATTSTVSDSQVSRPMDTVEATSSTSQDTCIVCTRVGGQRHWMQCKKKMSGLASPELCRITKSTQVVISLQKSVYLQYLFINNSATPSLSIRTFAIC